MSSTGPAADETGCFSRGTARVYWLQPQRKAPLGRQEGAPACGALERSELEAEIRFCTSLPPQCGQWTECAWLIEVVSCSKSVPQERHWYS